MTAVRNRFGVIAALVLTACKATGGAPAVSGSAAPLASVAAPPATAAAASAAETATAVEAVPVVPVTLGGLPAGAALYATARTAAVDALLDLVPDGEHARAALAERLGGRGKVADVLAGLGVSPDRPVLVAVVAPALGRARRVIDSAIAGKQLAAPASEPALATSIRILVPLASGRPSPLDFAVVGRLLEAKQVERCPGADVCQQVGGADLVGVVDARGLMASVRVKGDSAEIDLVRPLLGDASHASTLLALRALSALPAGGPEPPRCARLEPTALAWLCIDADRMAELGASTGYGLTVAAVSGASVSPRDRTKIMQVGRTEAGRNLELAAPSRRLLDDGTFIVVPRGKDLRLRGSWALTAASRPGIEAALGTEACVDGGAVGTELLPKLQRAFGDAGPDFAKPDEQVQHILEAGWAGYPIVFARTWPNLLPMVLAKLGPSAPELARAGRTCARVSDGRLEIESSAALFWQRKSP